MYKRQAIPYRTTFDKDATPVLSANEVVDAILKDLNAAEKLLKESDPLHFFTDQMGEELTEINQFLINQMCIRDRALRILREELGQKGNRN